MSYQVGSNPAVNFTANNNQVQNLSVSNPLLQSTTQNPNSIFDKALAPVTNNYEDDIMMAGMNFAVPQLSPAQNAQQEASPQIQQTQVPTPQQQDVSPQQQVPTFTSQTPVQNDTVSAFPKLPEVPKKSNVGKYLFTGAGFIAPIAGSLVDVAKGVAFKDAFKLKQLAVSCPVLAAGGLALGMLVDGFLTSKQNKVQKA